MASPLFSVARRPLHFLGSSFRSFISEPGSPSALDENLLRHLRSEIAYISDYRPPHPAPQRYGSFAIEDRSGEQWIRLRSRYGPEDIKIDATMFDGASPIPTSTLFKRVEAIEQGPRLHISLVVEVSMGEDSDSVLDFICSAWPDELKVEQVFPLRRKGVALRPYLGRDFKKLDKEVQKEVIEYLGEREVDDELAEFLQEYITNKDKTEMLRWLKIIESYIQKRLKKN